VISFPYIDFINKFNIFYNSYRILIGYYFTPADLSIEEHIKPGNVFPLLLRPYNSNFNDIIKILIIITHLNKGIIINLPKKTIDSKNNKIRLYIFPIYYTSNIL
ncbi:uncharacterized protein B0T23DRAFT_317796, partial [Neurospora hispaniola]